MHTLKRLSLSHSTLDFMQGLGEYCLRSFIGLSSSPFRVATALRRINEERTPAQRALKLNYDERCADYFAGANVGALLGGFIAAPLYTFVPLYAIISATEERFELSAIMAATNTISVLYEKVKLERKSHS